MEDTARQQMTIIEHQPNVEALASSAAQGCPLCVCLANTVNKSRPAWLSDPSSSEAPLGFMLAWRDFDHELAPVRFGMDFFTYTRYSNHEGMRFPDFMSGIAPKISLIAGDAPQFFGRPVSRSPSFELAKEWMNSCCESHETCPPLEDQALPTRLIDVGPADGSQEPKLVETATSFPQPARGKYLALSHCRGTQKPTLLVTKDTLAKSLVAIPFDALERSFKDAIIAMRSLGFRYLWIDSFCILQDDQEDWEKECGRMESVFANATMTLAALDSPDTQTGFLQERSPRDPSCEFDTLSLHQGHSVRLSVCQGFERDYTLFPGGPPILLTALRMRAWALQEELLSRRVLYFGDDQLKFTCSQWEFYEDLCYPAKQVRTSRKWLSGSPESMESMTRELKSREWYELIHEYSMRNLTFGDDRLPALSGIARRYQQASGDEYCAGLWREDLVLGLTWRKTMDLQGNAPATSTYQAEKYNPSWSWVSCDFSVSFDMRVNTPVATVIDVQASPVGHDLFGRVSSSLLTIQSRTKKGKFKLCESIFGTKTYEHRESVSLPTWGGSSYEAAMATLEPDDHRCPEWEQDEIEVLCLLLSTSNDLVSGPWKGIALLPAHGDTFRRIGYVNGSYSSDNSSRDWIDSGDLKTVRIV